MGENLQDKIIRASKEYERLTGKQGYLYTSKPGDGQTRVVFGGYAEVKQGHAAGWAYMSALLSDARDAYRKEFGPFDQEATNQVSTWICNDGDFYEPARKAAANVGQLREYLTKVLDRARKDSAAWYTRRHLSDSDMERVDWAEVAADLIGE